MRKVFAILTGLLILASSMHISIATHFCEGRLAAVKVSLSGEEATCGMKQHGSTCPSRAVVDDNCCKNVVSAYSINDNYNTSKFQIQKTQQELLFALLFPIIQIFDAATVANEITSSPPGNFLISGVKLAFICVFRK